MPNIVHYEKLKNVGTFKVDSGVLVVSDPCYDLATMKRGVEKLRAVNGIWTGYVAKGEADRVAELRVYHETVKPDSPLMWIQMDEVFVDSAQMSMVDEPAFRHDPNAFCNECCNHTLSKEQCGIIEGVDGSSAQWGAGIVSSTGWGDGSYTLWASLDNSGAVVAAMVVFLEEYCSEDWGDGDDC